jgi:hypothetical protein
MYASGGTRMLVNSPDQQQSQDQITRFTDPYMTGLGNVVRARIGWIRPENSTFSNLIAKTTGPNIWPLVDRLAKSFESTILTDLGQVKAKPNVLIDAELLQRYTSEFARWDSLRDPYWRGTPARADFQTLRHTTGPLVVRPSTLAINYLCQIPKRKPVADLLISVLVADLVFLQALWLLFTLGIGYWLKSRDERSEYCLGCAGRLDQTLENGESMRYERLQPNVKVSDVE